MTHNASDSSAVRFTVIPGEGYRFETNGRVKTYPIILGLNTQFERNVAAELGIKPQEVIAAIHRAGGLRHELGDEWSYGSELYSDTAKARDSIHAALRASPRELDSRLKYERVSIIGYQHLYATGAYYYDPIKRQAYWFDAESKVLHRTDSEDFKAHLSTRLQLSREDVAYKHIASWIDDRTIKFAQRVEPKQLSYYDAEKSVLYFNIKPGRVLVLDGGESIREEDNGESVLFLWDNEWESSNPRFDKSVEGTLSKYVFSRLILDEAESDLTAQEAELLNERWLLADLFRSIIPERPILALIAPPGSGKTTFAMLIGFVLFGKRFSVLGFEDPKEDGCIAYVTSSPLGVLDNADQPIRWLPDLLARVATGMSIPRRKLYTTNELAKYLADIFLIITARATPWARMDVIQRLLLERVKVPDKYIDRETLQKQVLANRDSLLGELLLKANLAIRVLKNNTTIVENSAYRLASFYKFAVSSVSETQRESLQRAFAKIGRAQSQLQLEQEENLLTLLIKFLSELPNDDIDRELSSRDGTVIWSLPLRVSELYSRLAGLAKTAGFRLTIKSPLSLGHRLGELRPTFVASRIPFVKGRDENGVFWRFGRRVELDENDVKDPSEPSVLQYPSQVAPNAEAAPKTNLVRNEGSRINRSATLQLPNEKENEGLKDMKDVASKVSTAIDERFENVQLLHPKVKRGTTELTENPTWTPSPDPDPARKAEPSPGRLRELEQKVIRALAENPDLEAFTEPTVWSMISSKDNVALEDVEAAFRKLAMDGKLFKSASGWRRTTK